MSPPVEESVIALTPSLWVYQGEINVGMLRAGEDALLVDFGAGGVLGRLAKLGLGRIGRVLVTHYHRDQAGALAYGAADQATVVVPAAERRLLESPGSYWADPAYRWHMYSGLAQRLVPTQPVKVAEVCQPGDRFGWGEATITVLGTPGHTAGSVSYQIDADGQRVIFSGDVIAGPGQIWDLFSLQRGGLPLAAGGTLSDYHGYLGARDELMRSLALLRSAGADTLVPSHGAVMRDPTAAIDLLVERLRGCYAQYAAISALRYYLPEVFAADQTLPMPLGGTQAPPDFLTQIGTSWVLISQEGAAFVMDCGSPEVVSQLEALLAQGAIRGVEGLWITHYHDDHVDACDRFLATFACPVYADASVAEVIEQPLAYDLPCLSPVTVPVQHRTGDGETWTWHEFKLTAYRFPGQTIHHGGLLVEGRNQRLFFAGDSLTPSGIDDYCMANRNYLGAGRGFDHCLRLLRKIAPDAVFNSHVPLGFHFTSEQYDLMLANLAARGQWYAAILPWDHPNYGLDPHWVRCSPYEQTIGAGERATIRALVTNHSGRPCRFSAKPAFPSAWGVASPSSKATVVPARSEGSLSFEIRVPPQVSAGQYLLPYWVEYDGRALGWIAEARVTVASQRPA